MSSLAIELIVDHHHGCTTIGGNSISTGRMPVKYSINTFEQTLANQIYFTSAALFGRRTINLDGSALVISCEPFAERYSSGCRGYTQSIVAATMTISIFLEGFAIWHCVLRQAR